LGSHATKGPAQPLRRAIRGLDPKKIARMFVNARCVGEKRIEEEDFFILKLAASPAALAEHNDGSTEIIWHALFGYFNQKTGFLVYVEDSHLTQIESTRNDVVYWETTIETTIDHYKPVDGVMIAHSGLDTSYLLARCGENELIDLITRCVLEPGDKISDFPPTFTMYEFDANANGENVIKVPRLSYFILDVFWYY
jgi:hypothetical protein